MNRNIASSGIPFAVALLVVAGFGLAGGVAIESSALSGRHDPGAKALPVGLSTCLLVCGMAELAVGVKRLVRQRTHATDKPFSGGPQGTSPVRVGTALAALVIYVAAIPWLGFQLATMLFAALMLYQLGAKWWSAALTAILLVVAIRIVFVSVLYVQLPEGVFDLAI